MHFATVIVLPRTATQDAYARLVADHSGQCGHAAARADLGSQTLMPLMDPAMATAVCRYDLSKGPLKVTVPVSPAYTSISFYTRSDVAYYAINDRAAGRRVIELDLMTHGAARAIAGRRRRDRRRPADRGIAEQHRPHRHPRTRARAGADAEGASRRRRGKLPADDGSERDAAVQPHAGSGPPERASKSGGALPRSRASVSLPARFRGNEWMWHVRITNQSALAKLGSRVHGGGR